MLLGKPISRPSRQDIPDEETGHKKSIYKWLFLIILLALLVVAGVIGFLRQPALQITFVEIEGARSLDPVRVQESAQSFITGFHAWVIPRSNVLLVSKSSWAKQLIHSIPTLEFVSIELVDRTRAIIHIVERDPMYVWCTSEHVLWAPLTPAASVSTAPAASPSCYFVDDNGYVFEPAPLFSRGVYLVFRGGVISEHDPLRNLITSKEKFLYIQKLVEILRSKNLSVVEINMFPDGDIKLIFDMLTGQAVGASTYLFVVGHTSSEKIGHMLDLMMQDTTFAEKFRSGPKDLEYIDFRFENKIIYKWKGVEETTQNE